MKLIKLFCYLLVIFLYSPLIQETPEFGGAMERSLLFLMLSKIGPCIILSNLSNTIWCVSLVGGGSYILSLLIRTFSLTFEMYSALFCDNKSAALLLGICSTVVLLLFGYWNTNCIYLSSCQIWLCLGCHFGNACDISKVPVKGEIEGWNISFWNITV